MRERLKPISDKLFTLPAESLWWLGEHLIRLEVEGEENLAQADEHLKEGSLLPYINHVSAIDPGLGLKVLLENLKNLSNKPAVFASQKHLDQKRGLINSAHSLIIRGTAMARKLELLPVVQEYDRNFYPNYVEINRSSLMKGIEIIRSRGGILLIAPEGTRSKTGALLEANEGIEKMLFWGRKTALALPIGIIGTKEFLKSENFIINLFVKIKLVVGKPISYQEAKTYSEKWQLPIKDVLMIKLACLLPEEYWGFYREQTKALLQNNL